MRISTVLMMVFISCAMLNAQNLKIKVGFDKNMDHPFFHSSDSVYNPLTLVFKDENGRTHYDNVPDSNKYATQANIVLNNDANRQMRFGSARLGDAVFYIDLEEIGPSESIRVSIVVKLDGGYGSVYSSTPAFGKADVMLRSATLLLSSNSPQKGELLKGKITFNAICKNNCGYQSYEGKGYFKCIVQ
jgi:hypothetical protein